MRGRRISTITIAVLFLVTTTTSYASSQAETPSATAVPTHVPSPTPTPAADPDAQIPAGWKRSEDDRLGFTLAVPFTCLKFDLHSGAVAPIAGLLGGDLAV